MGTKGLLGSEGSVEARIQLPQRSQKWDFSECSHLSVCVGGKCGKHNLERWRGGFRVPSSPATWASLHLVNGRWCYRRHGLS